MTEAGGAGARTNRRGFALPAAIIALVLLSALVAGALFIATEELRTGRTDIAVQRALASAEWALERAVVTWDLRHNTALDVGSSVTIADTALADGERVRVAATRVQRDAFWLTSHASSAGDGRVIPARHAVAASLRLTGPRVPPQAALATAGRVTVSGGGQVDGLGAAPDGADAGLCGDDGRSVAGVTVPDSVLVCAGDCGGVPSGVTGVPPVEVAVSAARDSAALPGDDDTRDQLTRRATIVLGEGALAPRPASSGVECDRGDPLNWGDPGSGGVCRHYLPVIWVRGSAVLAAGSVGQGILIVDGDLRLEPGARFAGVVLARDDIVVRGPGAEIVGTARAEDEDGLDGSVIADGGLVRFSGCAVRRAVLGAARLARTPGHWWSELR